MKRAADNQQQRSHFHVKKRKFNNRILGDFNNTAGIFFTVEQNKTKESKQESLALVEEYENQCFDLLPEEDKAKALQILQKKQENQKDEEQNEGDEEEKEENVNIASELAKELEDFKKKNTQSEFCEVLETKCKGWIFIRLAKFHDRHVNASKIACKIIESFMEKKDYETRFLFRMIPADMLIKAKKDEIEQNLKKMINEYLEQKKPTKMIAFQLDVKTLFSSIKSTDVIKIVTSAIPRPHFLTFSKGNVQIIVTVLKTSCGMSLVENPEKYHDFNFNKVKALINSSSSSSSTQNVKKPEIQESIPKTQKPEEKKDTVFIDFANENDIFSNFEEESPKIEIENPKIEAENPKIEAENPKPEENETTNPIKEAEAIQKPEEIEATKPKEEEKPKKKKFGGLKLL